VTAVDSSADKTARVLVQRRQRRALAMLKLVAGSYGIDFLLLALFAAAGSISVELVLLHGAAALCVCGVFGWLMLRPSSGQRGDPNFTWAQMLLATCIQLSGILLAPQLAFLFLNVLFIVFTFGTLRLRPRAAWRSWLLACLATAVCLYLSRAELRIPNQSALEIALVWLAYVSTLGRCILVGLYGNSIRIKLRAQNEQLAAFSQEIQRLATYDELTGVLNRRSISALIEELIALASPREQACCVILLDIDHFKSINDCYGHAGGDDVLRAFAVAVQDCLRETDCIGRYGGEEFIVLLPATSLADAQVIAERIRSRIAALTWSDLAPGLRMTVSGGIAAHRSGEPIRAFIARADHALYAAKQDGRNCMLTAALA